MRNILKSLIVLLWPYISRFLPYTKYIERLDRKIYMLKLYNTNPTQWIIEDLRSQGAKIGKNCLIFSQEFSTEPYLIDIGDHVVVSSGTQFITHDGSVWLYREDNPNITVFGRIKVGSNTFIGINCIILMNSEIGSNCIIGAGSVVRGKIPDNSVVMGNPGKVVMKTEMMKKLLLMNKDRVDTKHMTYSEREDALRRHFGI